MDNLRSLVPYQRIIECNLELVSNTTIQGYLLDLSGFGSRTQE